MGYGRSIHRATILKNIPRAARLLVCAMLAILCTAFVAKAQDTGYISGTVTDKSGAAVAGADVVISSTNGSATHTTTTNGDGAYVVAGLAGGTYDLVVTAKRILPIFGERCLCWMWHKRYAWTCN